MLHGRAAELAAIERLLVSASHQQSGALILTGEAGIGKTALLAHAAQYASGMQVLRVVGVESEAELAFAGLHQLLWPLHDGIERLPSPQADALRVAFGLVGAPVGGPNPFLVALATLSLLAEAAEERPVLCLVDEPTGSTAHRPTRCCLWLGGCKPRGWRCSSRPEKRRGICSFRPACLRAA